MRTDEGHDESKRQVQDGEHAPIKEGEEQEKDHSV